MKKIMSLFVICISFFNVFGFTVSASTESVEQIKYFEDGSYMITYVETSSMRASSEKTASKLSKYYNSNDKLLWSVTLTGTFSYTGTSAICTASSVSSQIYDSSWKVTEAVASKSGNKATGSFVVKKYVLLVPIQSNDVNLTLTCSATGNIT